MIASILAIFPLVFFISFDLVRNMKCAYNAVYCSVSLSYNPSMSLPTLIPLLDFVILAQIKLFLDTIYSFVTTCRF